MLPEEQELARLEGEQAELEEEVASAELTLETARTEIGQFQRRYYLTVGRLYAELDDLEAQIACAQAARRPTDAFAQTRANEARQHAEKSAAEAGLIEMQQASVEITPNLKRTYRAAAKLMHPDRATTDAERKRRTVMMAQVNLAYERGDQEAIEKLIAEFGQDPEAIAGTDIASRIVKAIRRIAQLRRRLEEVRSELEALSQTDLHHLKQTIEKAEARGDDPLSDLTERLQLDLSARRADLFAAQKKCA
jgi:hypothetical protein